MHLKLKLDKIDRQIIGKMRGKKISILNTHTYMLENTWIPRKKRKSYLYKVT